VKLYENVDEYVVARDMGGLEEDVKYIDMTEKNWLVMQRYLMVNDDWQEVILFAVGREGQEEQFNGWSMEKLVVEDMKLEDRGWKLLLERERYWIEMVILRVEMIEGELRWQNREECRGLENEIVKYGICG